MQVVCAYSLVREVGSLNTSLVLVTEQERGNVVVRIYNQRRETYSSIRSGVEWTLELIMYSER